MKVERSALLKHVERQTMFHFQFKPANSENMDEIVPIIVHSLEYDGGEKDWMTESTEPRKLYRPPIKAMMSGASAKKYANDNKKDIVGKKADLDAKKVDKAQAKQMKEEWSFCEHLFL